MNPPDAPSTVKRVVAVPSLWAPFHHRPAVTGLAAFAATIQPDAVVFLNAPTDLTRQAGRAFLAEVAAFRDAYQRPIVVHRDTDHDSADSAAFAGLDVVTLPESAPIVPGWLAESVERTTPPDGGGGEAAGTNLVCGATGRLRLTGRAVPTQDGTMQAWLVFECGTLAADPTAGTLGFGILEIDGTIITARPIRVDTDGSFTYRGMCFAPP
jgi:hypothetical protein